MKIVGQNILVKPFERNNISDGGLFIPDTVKMISNKVKVVGVGNGSKSRPMKLKEGQVGFRVKDWGIDVMVNGELHYIMDQTAIIALE